MACDPCCAWEDLIIPANFMNYWPYGDVKCSKCGEAYALGQGPTDVASTQALTNLLKGLIKHILEMEEKQLSVKEVNKLRSFLDLGWVDDAIEEHREEIIKNAKAANIQISRRNAPWKVTT
jgi:hypothetical protein